MSTSTEPNEEQSIKARSHLIYDNESKPAEPKTPHKPFAVYLRETPPTPLSIGIKALLGVIAVVVGLLLIAAMIRGTRPKAATKSSNFNPEICQSTFA